MDSFSILFRSDREHPVQIGHGTWHGLVDPDLLSVFSFCGVPLNRMYPVLTCYVMNPDHHMGHVKCYCYHFYWFAACCYGRMCAAMCVNSTIQNLVMQCQLSSLGSLFAISCGYSACETFCPEIYAAI
jgi:hypothetical protein